MGDVTLVFDNETPRHKCPLAVVNKVIPGQEEVICKVQKLTAKDRKGKCFKRPIHKFVLRLAKLKTDLDPFSIIRL